MNCPYCHAPLMIEDEVCAYCGKENPYFAKHREDLREFEEEFEETHQEVLAKVKITSRISTNMIIICVLIILNAIVMICTMNSWELNFAYENWYINKHEAEIRATLEAYSDAGDIIGLAEYCNELNIYNTSLKDYYSVNLAAQRYTYLYRDILELTILQDQTYSEPDELCESISEDLTWFYEAITQDSYDDVAQFSDQHLATMAMIESNLEILLEGYLSITPEEIPALLELSQARRAVAIEKEVLGNDAE